MQQAYVSTEDLADKLGIKPQTLRAALCRNGHYYGVRPIKMPNRMLRWPADAVQRVLGGGVCQ